MRIARRDRAETGWKIGSGVSKTGRVMEMVKRTVMVGRSLLQRFKEIDAAEESAELQEREVEVHCEIMKMVG